MMRRTRAKALAWLGAFIWTLGLVALFMGEPYVSLAFSLTGGLCAWLSIAVSKEWI